MQREEIQHAYKNLATAILAKVVEDLRIIKFLQKAGKPVPAQDKKILTKFLQNSPELHLYCELVGIDPDYYMKEVSEL